jgi:Ca-activated chloride channel family protein
MYPKKAVLVITDGIDTSSRRSSGDVQKAIRASGVLVYALAVDASDEARSFGVVDDGVDANALRKLTDDTGGRTEVVKGFTNLAGSTARLADEFNRQYVIGYAAPASRDGRWHSIKVEVRKRGANVRARAGYAAS